METKSDIRVNIRGIAVGGAGVGEVMTQHDGEKDLLGITAFIPYTSVGEIISAKVTERKKRHVLAELVEVEVPSDERQKPPCRYYGSCGGCELQHMSYGEQLRAKGEMILGSLRAAQCSATVLDALQEVLPGDPYHYRHRVNLHVDSTGRVGFYRSNSRSVVPIESCELVVPPIQQALANIQEVGRALQGTVSSISLEADKEGVIAVLKSPYDLGQAESQEVLSQVKKFFQSAILFIGEKEAGGFGRKILEYPLVEHGRVGIRIPAGGFSQVNWKVNRSLVSRIVSLNSGKRGTSIVDLFAGAGNFSLPLARSGAKVTAVESDPRLVSFGKESARRNNLEKYLQFEAVSVERFLKRNHKQLAVDAVVADPPRSGLGVLAKQLSWSEKTFSDLLPPTKFCA